jgi:D-lactate dehydrogenase (cytochrome)
MFAYLDFDAVVVTCGTCREALGAMEASKIFGCPVEDTARFLVARGLRLPGDGSYAYHAPCHDSLDGGGTELLRQACGIDAQVVPHCCSEAGTLALSRPDISDALRHRKSSALREAGTDSSKVLLTNCPSCIQGLRRNAGADETRHIMVELARRLSGDGWLDKVQAQVASAQAIHF